MKIAIVTNLYPPLSRGGAERVVQRTVSELVRRGHEVIVISSMQMLGRSALDPSVREISGETVYRFFPVNLYHVLKDHRYPYAIRAVWHLIDLLSPFASFRVGRILKHEKPDIVFTHNLKGIGMSIPRAIQRLNIPHIHVVHDVQMSVPSGLLLWEGRLSILERLLRRPYECLVRFLMGEPNLILSPSNYLADFYRSRGCFAKANFRVLPNPAPGFRQVHRASTRPAVPLRLLYAAQLEKHKGLMQLFDALDRLEIPVELHVAGEGTMAEYARLRADRDTRVNYHGFVSSESLQNLLEITDAVVVPSLCYENSPTLIYESLQAGVPVIASRIGGVGELIEDGQNGLLTEPANVQALAEAIRAFDARKQEFWSRSEPIHASVEKYSMTHYGDALEAIMQEVRKS